MSAPRGGERVSLRRLRLGELTVLVGAICLVVSLFVRSYSGPTGFLDAWDTFGVGVALELLLLAAALAMVLSALTERTPALPVATAVWCVPLGLLGVIAALVRALERPDRHDRGVLRCVAGAGGAVLVLAGAWQSIRDERQSMYRPAQPPPRPRP